MEKEHWLAELFEHSAEKEKRVFPSYIRELEALRRAGGEA